MLSSGVVSKTVPGRSFFFIQDQSGESVFGHFENVEMCQVNAHRCMYEINRPVTYNLLSNRQGLYATALRLDESQVSVELPLVEESTLAEWKHRYGFLHRIPCECPLFIGEQNWKKRIDEYGAIGRHVRHGVANDGARCYAVNAELFD